MPADAALPEKVLFAITEIEKHLASLPHDADWHPLDGQFRLFYSALVAFSGRHRLRFTIED